MPFPSATLEGWDHDAVVFASLSSFQWPIWTKSFQPKPHSSRSQSPPKRPTAHPHKTPSPIHPPVCHLHCPAHVTMGVVILLGRSQQQEPMRSVRSELGGAEDGAAWSFLSGCRSTSSMGAQRRQVTPYPQTPKCSCPVAPVRQVAQNHHKHPTSTSTPVKSCQARQLTATSAGRGEHDWPKAWVKSILEKNMSNGFQWNH